MKLARALGGDRFISSAVKRRVFPKNESGELGQFGGTDGVNTIFALYPRIGWTIVILANYDPPAAELMEAAMWSVMNGRACTILTEEEWLKQRQ